MTEKLLEDIVSKIRTDIPVLSNRDLSISGVVRSGSDIIIKYTGKNRVVPGITVYIETRENRIFQAVIGHQGSRGKLYAKVGSGVASYLG